MTEMEAYDALHRPMRDALKVAPLDVSARRAYWEFTVPTDVEEYARRLAWRLDNEAQA